MMFSSKLCNVFDEAFLFGVSIHRQKGFVGHRNSSFNFGQSFKIIKVVKEIRKHSRTTRQYLQMLALMVSCIEIIPYARFDMRPILTHLLYWWKPVSGDLDMQIPKSQHLVFHLYWWLQETNMSKGRSCLHRQKKHDNKHRCFSSRLGRKSRTSDCTRSLATREKRVAHKLSRVGSFSVDNQKFSAASVHQSVLITSDNMTMVQFISRQSGTKSSQLCYKTWEHNRSS